MAAYGVTVPQLGQLIHICVTSEDAMYCCCQTVVRPDSWHGPVLQGCLDNMGEGEGSLVVGAVRGHGEE